MAHINLRTIKDMLADADWLGGGSSVPQITKGSAGGRADPTAKAAQRLMDMRKKLEASRAEALTTYNAAITALRRIPDSDMQRILYLRHLKKLTWHEIAVKFGTGYTSDKLKQRYSRYCRGLQIGA